MQTEIDLSVTDPLIAPLVRPDARAAVTLLWQLDSRLAELATAGREPALRQIRLAWWRDALDSMDDANARVPDEPLLRDVAAILAPRLGGGALAELAEAYSGAVGSDWAPDDVMATGRALFALTERLEGAEAQGGGAAFGLARAALRTEADGIRASLLHAAAQAMVPAGQGRVLAVLDRLGQQIGKAKGQRFRRREQWLVLRVGLLGR